MKQLRQWMEQSRESEKFGSILHVIGIAGAIFVIATLINMVLAFRG